MVLHVLIAPVCQECHGYGIKSGSGRLSLVRVKK
jgi:hypothetical protein